MAGSLTKEQILDGIAELTVIELSELLKEFEEKFGVTAAAPVAVAAAAPAGGGAGGDGQDYKVAAEQRRHACGERLGVDIGAVGMHGAGVRGCEGGEDPGIDAGDVVAGEILAEDSVRHVGTVQGGKGRRGFEGRATRWRICPDSATIAVRARPKSYS